MIERKRGFVLLLALGLTLLPAPAADAEAEATPEEETAAAAGRVEYVEVNVSNLPESNTITRKLPTAPLRTPINLTTVSPALFTEQDDLVLGDALRNVSGVNVQSQNGVQDFFYIRGLDSLNGGLLLTDGVYEPEASFYHLYNVQGVEVLKGPGGFLYGSNPLAGTVNLVRKQALPAELLAVSASGGSYGAKETSLDWNTAGDDGRLAFRVNGLWNDSANYREAKDSKLQALNPSFAWRPDESQSLVASLEFVDANFSPDSGVPLFNGRIADVPRRRSYQSPLDYSDQQIQRYQLDYQVELNDRVTLRNKSYFRDLDWSSDGTLVVGVDSFSMPTPQVLRSFTTLVNQQQNVGNQFEVLYRQSAGAVQLSLLGGLEVSRLENEFSIGALAPPNPFNPFAMSMPSIDLYDPMETFTTRPADADIPVQSAGNSTSRVIAPYLVYQVEFSDKVQLMTGLRYDDVSYKDTLVGFKRDDSELSSSAGVSYTPLGDLTLYANAGQAFGPPPTRVSAGVDPATLQPEESRQYEVGLRNGFLGGKLRTGFALFQLERDNIGIPDSSGVTLQIGDQRTRGFEFELAAEPLPRLRTFASYAYTDAELTNFTETAFDPLSFMFVTVDRTGNSAPFAPDHLLNLWISKSWRNGWGVGGGTRFFSDQYIDEDNVFKLDGAVILDAAVFYEFKGWEFRLNLKNLTDREYEVRGFGDSSVIPANPFTAYATVGFRL